MRTAIVCVLVLVGVIGAAPARAQKQALGLAERPLAPHEAVFAALAAHRDGRARALALLASRTSPGPWLVVNELRKAGHEKTARAFASYAPEPIRDALDAYATLGPQPDDQALWKTALAAQKALSGRRPDEALLIVSEAEPFPERPSLHVADLLSIRAKALLTLRRHRAAAEAFDRAAERCRALGYLALEGNSLNLAAIAWKRAGRVDLEIARAEALLELQRRREDPRTIPIALVTLGAAYHRRGHYLEAIACFEESLALRLRSYVPRRLDIVIGNLGLCSHEIGDLPRAVSCLEYALHSAEDHGDLGGTAWALRTLAGVYGDLGDYDRSLASAHAALGLARKAKMPIDEARCLITIGKAQHRRGAFAEAIQCTEQALAIYESLNDARGRAIAHGNLGTIYMSLEDADRATKNLDRAITQLEEIGHGAAAANYLKSLAVVLSETDPDRAIACLTRAEAATRASGDRHTLTVVLNAKAEMLLLAKRYDEALTLVEEARRVATPLEVQALLVEIDLLEGELRWRAGDAEAGLALLDQARQRAVQAGERQLLVCVEGSLGQLYASSDQSEDAVRAGRRAVETLRTIASGLDDDHGARLRERFAQRFDAILHAAMRLQDPEEATFLLESTRGTVLLDAMHLRRRVDSELLPPHLKELLDEARAQESKAGVRLARAFQGRRRAEIRDAKRQHDAAQSALDEAILRAQREAKTAADLLFPRPRSLTALQAVLDPDEALVLYFLGRRTTDAVVIEADGARVARFGHRFVRAPLLAMDDPTEDVVQLSRSLRERLVDPLGLSSQTKRVLISPMGWIGYVPFSLLLPDREVVFVPSGTTYAELLERDPRQELTSSP